MVVYMDAPSAPSPGSLIRLDPERWEAAGIALVLEAPSDRFTDTDFMGRPYVWLLMPGEQGSEHPFQLPLGHVFEILSAPE